MWANEIPQSLLNNNKKHQYAYLKAYFFNFPVTIWADIIIIIIIIIVDLIYFNYYPNILMYSVTLVVFVY
jgi:hypothetical protein